MLEKAQGTTELIVLLAVVTTISLIIYYTSQTNLAQSNRVVLTSQARAAVNDLASAASEVYSEGPGARRKVYITIPEGAISSRVFANNTMINIGLQVDPTTIADINTQTTMTLVQGADFPTTPGDYWVWVTAKQGYVVIGSSNLNINPTTLSFTMPQSSSTSAVITFTDVGTVPFAVYLNPNWIYNNTVVMAPNSTGFALYPTTVGSTVYVNVTMQTYSNTSLGSYVGSILITTNTSETAVISIGVNVVGTQQSAGVSFITIDTFKNSSYSTPTTNFTLPQAVNINGSGWTNSTVTLTLQNSAGVVMSGYPTGVAADTGGSFSYTWNPAGVSPGSYTLIANQSGTTTNTSFTITTCS